METQLDYFDTIAKTQKQALESLIATQKQVSAQYLETMQKVQESITSLPGTPDTPQAKEATSLFNTWFSTMLNATKAISDENIKLQESWNGAVEKQLAISRDVVSELMQISKKATRK